MFTAKENRKSCQLSNLQCTVQYLNLHYDIVTLRVAIISNVQNVCLQRRHRPTDDASTGRWRGSQLTGPANNDTFITSLATLSSSNKLENACPVLYIIFGFGNAKIIEIG